MSTGDHLIVCLLYSSLFISHYEELIAPVTHPDPRIYKSSQDDSVSRLWNEKKVPFGEILVCLL